MTIQELLALINSINNQSGGSASPSGSASPATAASVSPSAISSLIPGLGGGSSNLGGSIGNIAGGIGGDILGTALGSALLSPLGAIGGTAIGDLITSLISSGVPRSAKTEAIGSSLEQSGNPLGTLVGQFIDTGAHGAGRVLSETGNQTFGNATETLATFLQALTGQQIPNVSATGGNFKKPASLTFPGLGLSGSHFQLPPGYSFLSDANAPDAAKIIEKLVGIQAPQGQPPQAEWQQVLQQLISKGDLTRYQGGLGSPNGATPTASGAGAASTAASGGSSNPTVSLPHPLSQPQAVQPPYPLTAGA